MELLAYLIESFLFALAGISVYTLANASNEFVTISSEHAPEKMISLLCFNRSDAESMLDRVREDGELGADAKVVCVELDKLYKFACEAAADLGPLTAFRFLPDRREVYNAIKLHQAAGHEADRLVGVPVFQVESLVITGADGKKSLPLFFSKMDADVAAREAFKENFDDATIEVGVLEDVLTRMESPGWRQWDSVSFVPPGKCEEMFSGAPVDTDETNDSRRRR